MVNWRAAVAGAAAAAAIGCADRDAAATDGDAARPAGARAAAVATGAAASAMRRASAAEHGAADKSAANEAKGANAAAVGAAKPPIPPLRVPVVGIARHQLVDTYTATRGTGSHDAIDIAAPSGTPVVAVDDGTIVKLFTSQRGGLTVYQFDCSGRLAYYYAHLEGYADGVAEGRAVRRGDPIGRVGTTGNARPDAPHLHFAIFVLGAERQWWVGTPVNPYPALVDDGRAASPLPPSSRPVCGVVPAGPRAGR